MAVLDLQKLKKDGVEVKVGQRVRWKNGVEAVKQQNGRYKIVKGASKEELKRVRGLRSVRKVITQEKAQRAFNKYYKNRKGSPRGNKQARTYDINYTSNLVNDSRYLRSPHRYDFKGVDDGKKVRKPRSALQVKNDKAMRAENSPLHLRQAGGVRGRKPKVHKVTGHLKPHMGSNGSACRPLVSRDCEKHPACVWRKYGKAKSKSCGRKPSPRTKKMKGGMSDYEE